AVGHRHAGGHLDDRQQRIKPLEGLALDGHANDRQRRVRRHDAGQMRRAARAGDDHTQAAGVSTSSVVGYFVGCAVRTQHARLRRDAEFLKRIRRGLHRRPIGIAAHENANQGFAHDSDRDFKIFSSSSLLFSRTDSPASRGTTSGAAMRNVARENGSGIMNASQLLTVILCATSYETGMIGAWVSWARLMTPSCTRYFGPRGPSGVMPAS